LSDPAGEHRHDPNQFASLDYVMANRDSSLDLATRVPSAKGYE
jgi:hypothetical protein